MSDIFYFWAGLIVVFAIVEIVTATFYGLSLALSSAVVLFYVDRTGELSLSIMQGVIFAFSSAIFAYILPKILISRQRDMPQGMEKYIGEKRKVKIVSDEAKITLDGVDYIVDGDDLVSGNLVVVDSFSRGRFHVSNVATGEK